MKYEIKPEGICPYLLSFVVENGKVKDVNFSGGCNGNLKGLASLVEGMDKDEVVKKLSGITCGNKGTSCPARLAEAIRDLAD
ncbi:MAG: TIGR03905 family TSCPD domain-containing protein [Oscillospiraceae bacterium]|jgi:uncharacterized protein (TIGR03905 family)|nr:TIGR03905 family TSCPD domain-containing protein [Oscillospiraceae bacterium]